MRNVDYSFLGEDNDVAKLSGLIPVRQRRMLGMNFYALIDNPERGLELSAENGFVEAFLFFQELGAKDFFKAIMLAARNGHAEIVKLCKDKVVDCFFAMNFAAQGEQYEIVDLVRSWGARDFDLAMAFAAAEGKLGMVKYLIKLGARDFERAKIWAKGHRKVEKYLQRQSLKWNLRNLRN